jgi:prephenate dehydrogenase
MARSFKQIAICGTGLIGTSLALALKRSRAGPAVVGFDLNADSRRGAASAKAVSGQKAFDDVSGNLAATLREADLVVLATPVRAIELLLGEVANLAAPGAVVTDTASTKRQVLAWAEALLPESLQFVGGHPLAGKVTAGPTEADGALFERAKYCLCPLARTEREAVERLVELVGSLGATPYFVDAHEHDGLAAAIHQLPYLLSVGAMSTVAEGAAWREAAGLAGADFAAVTHLTESDPEMLTDSVLTNREAVLRQLDRFAEQLTALRTEVASGDEALRQRFTRAQSEHRAWLSGQAAEGGDSREPIDTSALKPQSMLFGTRLGSLFRGRNREP